MRISIPVLFTLLFATSFCYGDQKTAEVIGVSECADCQQNNIKHSHAFEGLKVTIDCKLANGNMKRRAEGKLDKEGNFKVDLPHDLVEDGKKLKEECYAQLHGASGIPCSAYNGIESSKLTFVSKSDGKHTFSPVGKLKFSPVTCTSAFLWPHFKYPPLHKKSIPKLPFTFPKISCPPFLKKPFFKKHFFKKPFVSIPKHKKSFPPVPVYKKPCPPPVPVYKKPLPPPVPVYKKPLPPPVPVYKKPLPPPVPVYKKPLPPPVPVYKKPLPPPVPVYKKPLLPPVPIYKKPPVIPVYKPKPLPPITFPKKPCPPISIPKLPPFKFPHYPKFPPKVFEHPKYKKWPSLPPFTPHP
ncbi:proline-rich protein 4-like [Chenopodium quinoa]|uniref:proline-rich protein 4-like n=1 Tax=Chenopodium quinoa TaxID=63459 RepID=UPI000B794E7B|nr:proline-rich protein 4-like [Chenopodium quinoa]